MSRGSPWVRGKNTGLEKIVITHVFDADVVEKHKSYFVVKGASGRKYVLIPAKSFRTKSAGTLGNINYDQVKVTDRVRVYLSLGFRLYRLTFANASNCTA